MSIPTLIAQPATPKQRPDSASLRTLICLGVVGVAAALLFNNGVAGLSVTLFTLVLVAAVFAASHPQRPAHWGLATLALLVALVFSVRSSAWVLIPCAFALTMVMVAWVGLPQWASPFNISWGRAGRWTRVAARESVRSPRWAADGAADVVQRTGRDQLLGWIRGIAIALPLFVGLFLLLASADPVFGSALRPNFSPGGAITSLATAATASLAALVLIRVSRTNPAPDLPTASRIRMTRLEALIILSTIAALFTVFMGVQLMTSHGAGLETLTSQGITVAEYARSGYFQLLAVVFITAVALVTVDALRSASGEPRRSERALSIVIVFLTLAILVVALTRLSLYVDTFGLTMLRLVCIPGAIWMASLLAALVVWVLGYRRQRNWLIGVMGLSLLVTTLGFAAINPEARVVTYNLERSSQAPIDFDYLTSLSADATPALIDALSTLSAADEEYLRTELCASHRSPEAATSWSRWTLSDSVSRGALDELCQTYRGLPESPNIEPLVFTGTVNV